MTRLLPGLIVLFAAVLCIAVMTAPAAARVLLVGAGRPLKLPSQAAAVAQPGDAVRVDPGIYIDCAV